MINTLTLNPAVDHILFLKEVKKHITNRVYNTMLAVGGKGTHVSINLSLLGMPSRAFGFAYGANGLYILEALEKYGVDARFCYAADRESRNCYLLVEDDNTCTTIAEHGVDPTDAEMDSLLGKLAGSLQAQDVLVLSGDASNTHPGLYDDLMDLVQARSARVFLDTSGTMLAEGVRHRPFLIKPNREELAALCGLPAGSDAEVIRAIDSLDEHDIEVVAVSLGAGGSILRTRQGIYKASAPTVPVRNTAGCGDSYLSGLLYGYQKGMDAEEMLVLATAISAATAASPLSVGFDDAYAKSLENSCTVVQLR